MNYIKNKIAGTAVIAGALLLNSVIPSYAGWKDIKESAKETASQSWNYVKKHKWPFIAGAAAVTGGVVYLNKQEEEKRKNAPTADKDGDGYPNGEENREGSDPGNKDSEPQDGGWLLSINSINSRASAMPSKLETKVSDEPIITGPIVPVYIGLGKNNSLIGEFGKDKARIYLNYRF
jgi:hypothetical protein